MSSSQNAPHALRSRAWTVSLLLLAASPAGALEDAPEEPATLSPALEKALERIDSKELAAHVRFLASDEMRGRHAKSPEARRAAEYLQAQFLELGLEPLPDQEMFLPIEDPEIAPNVVAHIPGTGPDFVLIGAHYDHLAPLSDEGKQAGKKDRIFNGADDNASGTAALLEIAQAFKALPEPLEASIVFVAFTAEESGLVGSRYLVAHPPFPLANLRAMINLDMISRGKDDLIFCEGGAKAPHLRELSDRFSPIVELEVRYDLHPDWLSASDHDPFMKASIPTLYFGVEDHEDYHGVGDEADRILPDLARRVAGLTFLISAAVARAK